MPQRRGKLHCWDVGPIAEDGCSTTCMRERGHEGEHAWTRDDEVTIAFPSGDDLAGLAEKHPLVAELVLPKKQT